MDVEFGALSLLPTAVVLALAIRSHRTVESLIAGTIVAFIMTAGWGFLGELSEAVLTVMQDRDVAWVVLVCALYGSFIALIVKGGGANAFGRIVTRRVSSKRGGLLWTWALGLVIFLDDYLNSLTVSSSMKAVTDRYRTSREMLAYVVDSTAAPICLIIPISTWAVYFAGLLEKNGVAGEGSGIEVFIQSIPYMVYPFLAVLLVPLVILGVVPLLGAMKQAEHRAETTGQLAPTGSENLEIRDTYEAGDASESSASLFFVPLGTLIFFTIWFDIDLLMGVMAAIMLTLVQYTVQRVMSLTEMLDTLIEGLRVMVPVLCILIAVFTFIEANTAIGMTDYVIKTVAPYMTPQLLPVLTFITMAFVSFTTGSNWGVFAIAMPVVFPLAIELDVSIPLIAGALFSASGFGSQACFYSDSTVLTAQGAGCGPYEHAVTQLPYALIAAGLSALAYLAMAWWV
ncbi:Na+/H+ antiporter NhaC family protein [Halioglobus pacificus]|uniref:Na+/H+ antiporter NhaC family protein n=1 Tax=Parahalioglobus pacificus TaxID=930806 RepID=UPI001E5B0916|nr:Na+/H+ antiporter NhaC family protein [Halioglobus pacificus]